MEVVSQLPLAEVLFDFYDRLKFIAQGYGSFDYELLDYRRGDMVKVGILVNGEKVDAPSQMVRRELARPQALRYCERLAKAIPRQQFKIAVQGAIGGQIIARTTINPFRKDVTAKCYRGRHHPQEQAAREAEGGQEEDEDGGVGRDPAGGLRVGSPDRGRGRGLGPRPITRSTP
jgi:translation elongation factor EF-4